ncbi:hypothetical protein ACIQFP_10080 [Nocardiopsis alba]|uniref:hypothetical protein n=1 Tax=Nocardiopsis alba TaxID=53437 RepID=UPI0033C32F45
MTDRLISAISDCLDWARAARNPVPVETEALVLLLGVHRDRGAPDPADWTLDDVLEVAEAIRRRERPPHGFRDTWLSWCDHLVSTGRLISTESPRRLRALIETVDLDPIDPTTPVEEPAFEVAAPLLDRLGHGEVDADPIRPHLPAPPRDLDALAEDCPLLCRAARLADWVAPYRLLRPGTEHDALNDDDVVEAAETLDVAPEEIGPVFGVARAAGLLRTTYLHILPGSAARAWSRRHPGAAADAWADALFTMTALPGPTPFLLLGELFLTGRARSIADLAHIGAGEDDPAGHVHRSLEALSRLGAVEETAPGRYRITALGDHCVDRRLRVSGIDLPRIPPVSDLTAGELLDLAARVRPIDVEGLMDRWLAVRRPMGAAHDLLAAGLPPAGGDPEAFVRAVDARPWADTVLALVAEGALAPDTALVR